MAINVTTESKSVANQTIQGTFQIWNTLVITGLTANADNVIAHKLPKKPSFVNLRPGANGLWGEVSVDGTNITIHVGSGGATSGRIDTMHET